MVAAASIQFATTQVPAQTLATVTTPIIIIMALHAHSQTHASSTTAAARATPTAPVHRLVSQTARASRTIHQQTMGKVATPSTQAKSITADAAITHSGRSTPAIM